jgi:3-oxoacyl-[acyl-carrier protein] reductase
MNQQGPISGRVALVTGGAVGIGRATSLALASAGAIVGIHYHSSGKEAEETLEPIQKQGGKGILLKADLTVEKEALALVDRLIEKTGRLDILINNAGSPVQMSAIEHCSTELWKRVFDLNVTSAFLVTRQAIPHLRASGHGCIINNLTLSIQTGGSGGGGPYAAAKGALQVMTRTLARELGPAIRVNAVMPGVIETRHHEVYSTPAKLADYRKQTPLGRNGTAEEVAQAILFLAGDGAGFINGAIIDINGGRFLR